MKRLLPLGLIVALVMGAGFLTSCSQPEAGPEPGEPTSPEVETVETVETVEEGDALAPSEAPVAPASEPEEPKAAQAESVTVSQAESATMKTEESPSAAALAGSESLAVITLGGGCFWCTEAVMQRVTGVQEVVSGYMGGHVENPTYEQIITKTTGHAEVIQVTFDQVEISLDELLDIFWQAHDPTTLNRQGADVGPQYRSVIFYHSPEQRNIAEQSKRALDESGMYSDPAVTEITAASTFWEAEEYHQNYYTLNKDTNPYCRVVISPKLEKLGLD